MSTKTVLLIEDEEDIIKVVRYSLEKEGYKVVSETSGLKGLDKAQSIRPDLILLDITLPEMNGTDVCKHLKKHSTFQIIPVIILSAKNHEIDVVMGLELGAVDYITKPFSIKILLARVRAALRKSCLPENSEKCIKIADVLVYPSKYEAVVNGKALRLTVTETKILQLLTSRRGAVFSRYQIVDAVHGADYDVSERAVDVQIAGIRKKLGNSSSYLETIRGAGYRLKA